MGVWMHLLDACKPNTISMVLMVRAQMNMGNLQEAVRLFLDNKVGQAQGYARTELMELVLPDMLSKYALSSLQRFLTIYVDSAFFEVKYCYFLVLWMIKLLLSAQCGLSS